MDARARQGSLVLTHFATGELALDEAAAYLSRSTRQVGRLLAAFAAGGRGALVHRNTGPVPANRLTEATTARVVELARTRDAGFNTVHLAEALAEDGETFLDSRQRLATRDPRRSTGQGRTQRPWPRGSRPHRRPAAD